MNSELSETVKELIGKTKIVSFASWKNSHPPEVIEIFQAADDKSRYLTDADLERIQTLLPDKSALLEIARLLRDRAPEIVAEASKEVLDQYPDIAEPGGSLYPPVRAEACWRDFWQFLRCITYGIAGGAIPFTSSQGLCYMNLLYKELQVPIDAMLLGLEGIKTASLRRVSDSEKATIAPYFEHLIEYLKLFSASSFC